MPTSSESIGFVRAASGAVNLPVNNVTVTYIKPVGGNMTNDPAGFTVQAEQNGPAVMIAVNPANLTPVPVVGDVVSFTVTEVTVTAMQPRATMITGFTRVSQGANVGALAQNVSAATDLVTALPSYDSEIVDVSGTIAANFITAGSGFEQGQVTTTGIAAASMNFVLRVPTTMRDSNDLVMGCNFTLDNTPVHTFNTTTQLTAFAAADITITNCPAPVVVAAVATSATSVNITFSRNLAPGSVNVNGSQFTFDNGLTASAASVNGRVVTVTTSVQVNGTMHIATVANTVTDTFGTTLGTPNTAMFTAFMSPTHLVINEVDYDMPGSPDNAEFIEIFNPTPSAQPLANLSVVLVNGSDSTEYRRFDLGPVATDLAAGAYLVIRRSTLTVPGGTLTIDMMADDLVQNGAPDAIALVNTSTTTVIDAISYEGGVTAAVITGFTGTRNLVEGTMAAASDAGATSSIGRNPNGIDSDNASADWAVRATPSPGAAN
jgi:hypothetical protein